MIALSLGLYFINLFIEIIVVVKKRKLTKENLERLKE
jgi:hypothetical protein